MAFKKLLTIIIALGVFGQSYAQLNGNCPGCVANTLAFGASPAASAYGLSPDSFVIRQDDTIGINVTYMLPTSIQASGVTATVSKVQILGVNGTAPLPSGLSITCDQTATQCTYYPQTNRFGCVKICGATPDPATNGWVAAKITVAGTGSALGQTQTQDQDITVYYMILPDTNACHAVCFQNKVSSGCDSANIGVYPGIDITCADPVLHPCSFNWNYGNGQTNNTLAPTAVDYTAPGTYPVTLEKMVQGLVITEVDLIGASGWSNICNFFGLNGSANNYSVNLTVGTNTYNTGGGGSGAHTWTGLNYAVTDQAIAVEVADACLATNLSSSTATLLVTGPGTYQWSVPGSNSATGSITVALVDQDSTYYADSVHIYASPASPVITASNDSICQGDSVLLSIGSQYAGYTLHWFQDSVYLISLTDTSVYVSNSGHYFVTAINPVTQCKSMSDTVTVAVSGILPPAATIVNAGSTLFLNPFVPGAYAEWYYDSVLVAGQNGVSIPYLGTGIYYAKVYPTGFPQCGIISAIDTVLPSGITETQSDVYNLSVYPNPNNGVFSVRVNVINQGTVSEKLTDILGRTAYENSLTNRSGEVKDQINVSGLAKGVYTLEVTTDKGKATKRVVVE